VPKIRPNVEVASPGGANTIYQTTAAWADAPLPWDFLLWDRKGGPMVGVTVEMVNSDFALLKQGKRAVGNIRIHAPDGAQGHVMSGLSELGASPIKGVPTGRLAVQFRAGSASGRYTTTVTMHGGNALNMFVDVP
jgi:hypothetical protein